MSLRFVLTLHSHLPWVLHHGRWPHGSDWICEAALDTYLPLVQLLDTMEREGIAAPITLGVTPILAAQLAHPSFVEELEAYFAHRLQTLDEAPDSLRESGDHNLLPQVAFWRSHIEGLQATWRQIDGNLIAAFRHHAEAGRIELISSAATHGFLPLLARDESIRLQLLAGRAEHLRQFGELPQGCWVPECAYRPRGPWQPLPAAPYQHDRAGIEDHLRYAGFRWFFVDAHLAEAGEAFEVYEGKVRRRAMPAMRRSPYRAYQVGTPPSGRPIHVLVRDPQTTTQVWSRHGGYPGDGNYLEFHKIRYPGGLKLWSVTDTAADLGEKQPYHPERARAAALRHAEHFRTLLQAVSAAALRGDTAIVAPFDTELFGHWWFEGVDFLHDLYQEIAAQGGVRPVSAGRLLREAPPTTALHLGEGSWGANGDFSKWLNPETEWTWERLWPLEERFWNAAPGALARPDLTPILEQAARELLLLQSSDWQFIISTGAAGDYATKRFVEHCEALESLLPTLEQLPWNIDGALAHAAALRRIDGPFPELLGAIAAASDITVS
ncbi:MAG: 1,4-alpha-glucan branching protein domain-containing protein [Gemmatimonadota bacterium]